MTNFDVNYDHCPKCHAVVYHQGCYNCKHYYGHYGRRDNGEFHEIFIGHCISGHKRKQCQPTNKACQYWEAKE